MRTGRSDLDIVPEDADFVVVLQIEPVSIRDRWPILPGQIVMQDGHITVPDGPGLGIVVDEALVRRLVEMTDIPEGL